MRLHALVSDLDTAKAAIEGGATVIQLRLKDRPTREVVDEGRAYRHLCALHGITFVVNDDCEAAVELGADGVHLGRNDRGAKDAVEAGLMLGTSAASVEEAVDGEQVGSAYVGAGPVWETPSKPDAEPAIGLEGLTAIAEAVSIPVIAIGGVDASNAGDCVAAGAAGVAVVRAAADARNVRAAIDEALAAR
jgi:thiamine-phosphate pyrophosphorylase